MPMLLTSVIDKWIGRAAAPSPAALEAVRGLSPAVVVTGGSAGIGLALANRFATAGRQVALVAREETRLAAAAGEVTRAGGRDATAIVLDVTAADAPANLEVALSAHRLYLDVLVNCAGIGLAGEFEAAAARDIDRLVALNVTALTRLMRHAFPQMKARGSGGILNVASLAGYAPGPYQAAYYASKAYVLSLTEALAAEAAGNGVRICVVAPGPVETRFHSRMGSEGALYRTFIRGLTPNAVAASAYRGFMLGRRVVVPGLLPTVLMLAARVTPHPLLVPIMGLLLRPPAKGTT